MPTIPHVVPPDRQNLVIQWRSHHRSNRMLISFREVRTSEVFDFLPDEVFDPSTQPTDYADDKVTNVLNSPLPLPATSPLNHPDCNDEPPVISSSQTQTQLSSGSLEVSPPRVTCQS
ncbi:hypothetical protein PSTG_04840 [Puccinia striiformis f. sp. tritici PST-78]|uniref:Uncharacterized protein n=1 Tax=Puccinia striiformis f. sp. tritici PST-78 TaxID=1165861 RepID=A0A0L0VRW7_9BASI|nr:hypothetical protein PSTG_04840 [Puccinia striiformis f. sp. tritici PST-78]